MKKKQSVYYTPEQWELYDKLMDARLFLIKALAEIKRRRDSWTRDDILLHNEIWDMNNIIEGHIRAMQQGRVQY